MSERIDQKLRDVVVAQYRYRHEAEFAAGFLDDAEIPYRLVVDDASLGMTISAPATIWVRAMDEAEAREVLDLPEQPKTPVGSGSAVRSPHAPARRPTDEVVRHQGDRGGGLGAAERLLGLVVSGAGAGGAWAVVQATGSWAWPSVLLALSAPFLVAGLLGRAPGIVRDLLRAWAGRAP